MYFIDYLTVFQKFEFELPTVGKDTILSFDTHTGNINFETVSDMTVEGSYSSKIRIKSLGHTLQIKGNPSRFKRKDSLFGITDIHQCLDIYNQIIDDINLELSISLPHFSFSTFHAFSQLPDSKGDTASIQDGCYLTRIDITRNISVGQGNEHCFIRGLSTMKLPYTKEPFLYANNNTVDWGSRVSKKGDKRTYSRHRYIKVYAKGQDLERNFKITDDDDYNNYMTNLIQYAYSIGIVREETSLKHAFFEKNKHLKYLKSTTTLEDFMPHAQSIENAISTLSVTNTQIESISEALVNLGVCTSRQASSTEHVYDLWRQGRIIDEKSARTIYRHRKRLLTIGIDISIPFDLSKLPVRIKSEELIEVNKSIQIPDWYEMPFSKPYLKAI